VAPEDGRSVRKFRRSAAAGDEDGDLDIDLEGVPTKHLYVENEERKAKLLVLSDQRTTVRNEETTAI
jgi:hypothetical protein